jgi:hypothetical protein
MQHKHGNAAIRRNSCCYKALPPNPTRFYIEGRRCSVPELSAHSTAMKPTKRQLSAETTGFGRRTLRVNVPQANDSPEDRVPGPQWTATS